MRAAVFLRVSTDRQDEENQLAACARRAAYGDAAVPWVTGAGLIFRTKVSGSGPDFDVDPVRAKILADARAGMFEIIIVWALDRWTRAGILGLFSDVAALKRCGVRLVSVQEPWAENELLLAIAAWNAEQEKLRRRERTTAALDHRRGLIKTAGGYWRPGKSPAEKPRWVSGFGRPQRDIPGKAVVRANALRATGLSWREVAKAVAREGLGGYPSRTLQRRCSSNPALELDAARAVGENVGENGGGKAA